jgi:hypothetical protein
MMELTREQIIQALEYCTGIKSIDACANCPACLGCNDCADFLREESLVLIKELTEERDRCLEALSELADNVGLLKDKAKADTVQKMQDLLAMHFGTYTDKTTVKVVDVFKLMSQIAEEVLEENNG